MAARSQLHVHRKLYKTTSENEDISSNQVNLSHSYNTEIPLDSCWDCEKKTNNALPPENFLN